MAASFTMIQNITRRVFGSFSLSYRTFLALNPKHIVPQVRYGYATQTGTNGYSMNFLSRVSIRPNAKSAFRFAALFICGGVTASSASQLFHFHSWKNMKVFAENSERPIPKPSRQLRVDTDNTGLKLTLYQYQTCPFCCKVRAVLDYHGFSYDVIEVNSVSKKQLKWSEYQKVPILMVEGTEAGSLEELALHDSTVIISILESYLHDRSTTVKKFHSYYPSIKEKVGRKMKYDFPNKYFIMFQEKTDIGSTPKERSEERKWREWADAHLVHMLSPNAYRTVREALQAFNYFSEVGQWEQNFSVMERQIVIYAGAAVMYIMGIILKYKYDLKDDVRQSLYDACNEWVNVVGNDRPFHGGNQPNLADLAVYGVLSSIEGCIAFQDTLKHSKIGPWYNRTKQAVINHQGSHPLSTKTVPSDVPKTKK